MSHRKGLGVRAATSLVPKGCRRGAAPGTPQSGLSPPPAPCGSGWQLRGASERGVGVETSEDATAHPGGGLERTRRGRRAPQEGPVPLGAP